MYSSIQLQLKSKTNRFANSSPNQYPNTWNTPLYSVEETLLKRYVIKWISFSNTIRWNRFTKLLSLPKLPAIGITSERGKRKAHVMWCWRTGKTDECYVNKLIPFLGEKSLAWKWFMQNVNSGKDEGKNSR